jgi:hypothetical protein
MPDGSLFVYKCARDAHEQITRLWDFMSPTIVAMWNLRWQVQGFLTVRPEATQEELVQRFALGSAIRGNEIKRACVVNSWEEQQGRFATILLTNTIAIFEEFLDGLVGLTITNEAQARRTVKALQYPVASGGRSYQQGYAELGATIPKLTGVFNSGAALGRWYSGAHIENLLRCYRFFKEIRNAGAHSGSRATPELMQAYAAFQPVATAARLGVKQVPNHSAPELGQVMLPDLRGTYAFSDVVLRLIATYDRDLSDRNGAFLDIDARLSRISALQRARTNLPDKQKKLITGLLINANLPRGNLTNGFMSYLRETDRIPVNW